MVVSSSVSPPGQSSWTRTRPPDVAPSLHRHYSDFITTTSDSAPVPRIGTQVLVGSPLERLPWHRDDWFPQFRRKARIRLTPPARRTPPGQPSGQPPDFSRRYHPPSVSMSCTGSRRVSSGSLAFVFLIHTCRVMLDVSPTLTTATLNDMGLIRFRGHVPKGGYDVHDAQDDEVPATTPVV